MIKKASMSDLAEVIKLNQELFHHDYQFDNTLNVKWPQKNKKYYSDRIKRKNSIVLVAKEEGKTIGYLIGSIEKAESWRTVKSIAELENMLVHQNYRGKGIGSNLIKEFIKWAKEKKADRAKVVASAENKKAIEVYMKNGFKEYNDVMELNL